MTEATRPAKRKVAPLRVETLDAAFVEVLVLAEPVAVPVRETEVAVSTPVEVEFVVGVKGAVIP